MKRRVCCIDDDARFEIPLFVRAFCERFDLVTAADFDECQAQIGKRGGWRAELFILDMYFSVEAPDSAAIAELEGQPLRLHGDGGQIRPAYMNYVAARDRLAAVLDAWRQSADGGIALARCVRAAYPGVPIVFYSRKATAEDALRCVLEDGVWDVLTKPTGATDEETERLTMAARDTLGSRFEAIIATAQSGAQVETLDAVRTLSRAVSFFSSVAQRVEGRGVGG